MWVKLRISACIQGKPISSGCTLIHISLSCISMCPSKSFIIANIFASITTLGNAFQTPTTLCKGNICHTHTHETSPTHFIDVPSCIGCFLGIKGPDYHLCCEVTLGNLTSPSYLNVILNFKIKRGSDNDLPRTPSSHFTWLALARQPHEEPFLHIPSRMHEAAGWTTTRTRCIRPWDLHLTWVSNRKNFRCHTIKKVLFLE